MPPSAEPPARRETTAREVARRREAVGMLRLAESIAGYAAGQLVNGLSPEQARRAALDAAGELDAVAGNLRRLAVARLDVAERRALAAELAAAGMSARQIAGRIGVAPSTVWDYLSGRRGLAGRRPARGTVTSSAAAAGSEASPPGGFLSRADPRRAER